MKTLKDYMNIKDNEERIHTFLDDNAEHMENYISDCPDFINQYDCVLFDTELYLDECDDDIKVLLEYLIENNELDIIYDNCSIDMTSGYWRRSNELASCSLGEQEVQFSGLHDNDSKSNCIYTEISKDIPKDELKGILDSSSQCISGDCLYLDYSYDRVSLILDDENLVNNFLKKAV